MNGANDKVRRVLIQRLGMRCAFHQLGNDMSIREANTASTANVGDGLSQTGPREPPLELVASRKRDHAPDQHTTVLHTHQR